MEGISKCAQSTEVWHRGCFFSALVYTAQSLVHGLLGCSHLGLDLLYCLFMPIIYWFWLWRSICLLKSPISNFVVNSLNSHIKSLLHCLSFNLCLLNSSNMFSVLINGWVLKLVLRSFLSFGKLLEYWGLWHWRKARKGLLCLLGLLLGS